jgi:lipoprotein-anchoring transpeptidase ErfK/SrfK
MLLRELALLIILFSFVQGVQAECLAESCATGLDTATIEAYPGPQVDMLTVNDRLLHDRNYWRVDGALQIYDAPGGNVVRTLDAGFNFLTTISVQDGWAEINPGEWIPLANLKNSNWVISRFTGVLLPEEIPSYPIAWMLINAYASSEPGGPALESNELLYRYTQVNIFDAVKLDGWNWYQVGPDMWVQQTGVAKVMPVERPAEVDTERWVSIDLYEQVLIAYEGDQPVFATLISSGLPRWPTYEGLFHIYYRRTREQMSWGTPGDDFYYLEEVPWTMYFDKGRALHGAYWHDGFGYRRSHGCVNMTITDAHWLYNWGAEDFATLNSPDVETGPAVYVYSSGVYQ